MSANGQFSPELGQMAFGQPHQHFDVPKCMTRTLDAVDACLTAIMERVTGKDYFSPFGNNGGQFNCSTFKVHAYSWADEEQAFNFAWRDLRISWYKHSHRGLSANMDVTSDIASACLRECLDAIEAFEKAHAPSHIGSKPLRKPSVELRELVLSELGHPSGVTVVAKDGTIVVQMPSRTSIPQDKLLHNYEGFEIDYVVVGVPTAGQW